MLKGGHVSISFSRCEWQEPSDGAPWCTFPIDYGYTMEGDPEELPRALGYKVELKRKNYPTLFGNDLDHINLFVEFHHDYRLRIKVISFKGRRQIKRSGSALILP